MRSSRRSAQAGGAIEHGQLVDEATVALMAEHGTWWCLQPFLDDEDAKPHPEPAKRAKQVQVAAGTDRAYELARKHGVKVAWGSDILYNAKLAARQGARLTKLTRWYSPAEVLRMATSANAELLALSGARNPTRVLSASSARVPWPISCSSTETHWRISACWSSRPRPCR